MFPVLCIVFLQFASLGWPHATHERLSPLIDMHIAALMGRSQFQHTSALDHKIQLTMWYGIQAVTLQRLGYKRSGILAFERALHLCLDVEMWVQSPHRVDIALSYTQVIFYLCGLSSRESTTRLFIGCLRVFLHYQDMKADRTSEQDRKIVAWIKMCVHFTEMVIEVNNDSVYEQWKLHDKMVCLMQYVETSEKMAEREKILHIMRDMIDVVKDNTYPRDRLNYVLQQCDSLIEMTNSALISSNRPIGALNITIMLSGFKIEALIDLERYINHHIMAAVEEAAAASTNVAPEVESPPSFAQLMTMYQSMQRLKRLVADYISKCIATRSTWIPLLSVMVQRYLVLAAEVHLQYARIYLDSRQAQQQQQRQQKVPQHQGTKLEDILTNSFEYMIEELLAYMRADLWALETFEKKFDICDKAKLLIRDLSNTIESIDIPAQNQANQTQPQLQPQSTSSTSSLPVSSGYDSTNAPIIQQEVKPDGTFESFNTMDAALLSLFQVDALDLQTTDPYFDTSAGLDLQFQQRQYLEDLSKQLDI